MGISENTVQEIVRRLTSAVRPDKIILFGSAARGGMSPDSDIDLLVVEKDARNPREESIRLRDAIDDVGYPVDVFVVSTEYFENTKNIFGGLAYPAHKYGKVIYDGG